MVLQQKGGDNELINSSSYLVDRVPTPYNFTNENDSNQAIFGNVGYLTKNAGNRTSYTIMP